MSNMLLQKFTLLKCSTHIVEVLIKLTFFSFSRFISSEKLVQVPERKRLKYFKWCKVSFYILIPESVLAIYNTTCMPIHPYLLFTVLIFCQSTITFGFQIFSKSNF